MDQYSAIFNEAIQRESEALLDDELLADAVSREMASPGVNPDTAAEQVDTLGVFRGMMVGVPVAAVLWAPIVAAGYFLMG